METTAEKVIWCFSQALTMFTLKQAILSLFLDRIMSHSLLGMPARAPMELESVRNLKISLLVILFVFFFPKSKERGLACVSQMQRYE